MATITEPNFDLDLLADVFGQDEANWPTSFAQWLLTLQFSQSQQDRMRELAEGGNQGVLTSDEHGELASYRRVGNLISRLRARAAICLRNRGLGE
jgi:hypothetical protein